jgi:hypothetical protein
MRKQMMGKSVGDENIHLGCFPVPSQVIAKLRAGTKAHPYDAAIKDILCLCFK